MPQGQRPQGLKLRKVPSQRGREGWRARWGHTGIAYDYGRDIFALHILDWYLWKATRDLPFNHASLESRIGRYLDGEEEKEGLYR